MVDDDAHILEVFGEFFEILGYKLWSASGPLEAIELFGSHKDEIDILVSDIMMPDMLGTELFTRLKAMKPSLHCLLMSGFIKETPELREAIRNGAMFLAKPCRFSEIEEILKGFSSKD